MEAKIIMSRLLSSLTLHLPSDYAESYSKIYNKTRGQCSLHPGDLVSIDLQLAL